MSHFTKNECFNTSETINLDSNRESMLNSIEATEKILELRNVVMKAIDFVEAHLQEPISLKEVTGEFETSHWYFQRLFRSVVGVSIGQYLRLRRLSESAVLLKKSKMKIIDIAVLFDFGSQEAYARAFKQFALMTPTEYRETEKFVIRQFQNKLTHEKLNYFWNNIQRTPEIKKIESKYLVGSLVDFQSHFEEGSDCAIKVVKHWQDFLKTKNSIQSQKSEKLYGIALSSEKELREKKLKYFAGVEIIEKQNDLSVFTELELPAGTYAAFENKGLAQHHSSLIDYVYGIWLVNSEFQRGIGYDFEVFDHRYKLGDPDSISFLYIPIMPK